MENQQTTWHKYKPSDDKFSGGMMQALVADGKGLQLQQMKIPKPGTDEVLIRVVASPINPSDLAFVKGIYPAKKKFPCVPGFEGSGYVVETGDSQEARAMLGNKVTFWAAKGQYGAWAEYAVVKTKSCLPLDWDIDMFQASVMVANPLTTVMMMEFIKKGKHQAMLQTAAGSALGRMMVRACYAEGIKTINIVRKAEVVEELKLEGANHVLVDDGSETFYKEVMRLCHENNATIFFDAVSGPQTGKLLGLMPRNSECYVYGALTGRPIGGLNFLDLAMHNKTVKTYWLTNELKERGSWKKFKWLFLEQIKNKVQTVFKTNVYAKFTYDKFYDALACYIQNSSKGKIVLTSPAFLEEAKPEIKPSL